MGRPGRGAAGRQRKFRLPSAGRRRPILGIVRERNCWPARRRRRPCCRHGTAVQVGPPERRRSARLGDGKMTTVSPPAAPASHTATAATPTATPGKGSIAGDFDRFLLLLTTQLQNQDTLSPLEATQYTTQHVKSRHAEQCVKRKRGT